MAGKALTHCRRGHEFVPENLYVDYRGNRTCKTCRLESNRKERSKRRAGQSDLYKKLEQVWNKYHLPAELYLRMLENQNGLCSICYEHMAMICVDHDHTCCPKAGRSCGKCVRGLICSSCNRGLGAFKDNIDSLNKATEYLRRYNAKHL